MLGIRGVLRVYTGILFRIVHTLKTIGQLCMCRWWANRPDLANFPQTRATFFVSDPKNKTIIRLPKNAKNEERRRDRYI